MSLVASRAQTIEALLRGVESLAEEDERVASAAEVVSHLILAGYWTRALAIADQVTSCLKADVASVEFGLLAAQAEVGLSRLPEALRRLRGILSRLGDIEHERRADLELRAQNLLGAAYWKCGRLEEAETTLSHVYRDYLRRPDSAGLGWAACDLGNVAWTRGNLREARRRYEEAAVSAERAGSLHLKGVAQRNLGMLYRQFCWWAQARECFNVALGSWDGFENRIERSHLERALGIVDFKLGRLDDASREIEAAIELGRELQSNPCIGFGLLASAQVAIHAGLFVDATRVIKESEDSLRDSSYSRPALLATEYLGDVHLEQGQAEEALRYYDEVWPKAMALVPRGDIVAELRRRRAECYLLLGRAEDAYAAAKEALAHCRELGDRYEEAATYRVLALSAAAVGKADEARQYFTQGFAYYDDIETPYEWGKLWMAYGDWLNAENSGAQRDTRAAREAYLAARDHFSHMGARGKLREVEARLSANAASVSSVTVVSEASAAPQGSGPTRPLRRRPMRESELAAKFEWCWQNFGIVTRHEPVLDLLGRAAKLALSDAPILVTGETGAGKELVAAGIHRLSKVKGEYVPLNCAAVPKEMIETELFGHARGAFSGAIGERIGLVEVAADGTLFLDEVGEMSEPMQAKLLRFLESGEYRRVGESANRRVKERVIGATNVPLEELAKGEGFRRDLYWRLAHGVLEVPPLRRRPGDAMLLLDHFLRIESRKMNKLHLTISPEARAELERYAWPGNVRELMGVVRRAVALAEQTIEREHLELTPARQVANSLTEEIAETERIRIDRAMRENHNSPTAAARALGIPRTTLVMKLKRMKKR